MNMPNPDRNCTIVDSVKLVEVDSLPERFHPDWDNKWGTSFLYSVLVRLKETFAKNPELDRLCCYYNRFRDKDHFFICNDDIVEHELRQIFIER